tara:strand:- start:272 stop:967 length:696 start_codon:yes stop_codon:yes gene_type:complete
MIGEDPGTGLQIYENYGKLEKIKLDTKTPRGAPENSFTLFYDKVAKTFDKKFKSLYNNRIHRNKGKSKRKIMTSKAQKLLDILSLGLYNRRINKQKGKEKIMADQPNYTDAMVSELVAAYEDAPTRATVDQFASKFNKPARSIIAKLVREGVYQAVARATKQGTPVVRKSELVFAIEEQLHSNFPSLAKASKTDLVEMLDVIRRINGRVEDMAENNERLQRRVNKEAVAAS